MVVLLPDILEDLAITLASVRLMLDILVDFMVDILVPVDSMVDMLATAVDSFGKLLNYRRADNELFPLDELYTSHAVLNKLDTKKEFTL